MQRVVKRLSACADLPGCSVVRCVGRAQESSVLRAVVTGFAGACLVIFVAALLYEALKWVREEMMRRHNVRVANVQLHGSPQEKSATFSVA